MRARVVMVGVVLGLLSAGLPAAANNDTVGVWTAGTAMPVALSEPEVVQLDKRRLMVVSGLDESWTIRGPLVYDADIDQWRAAAAMAAPRRNVTAVVLHDGRVLVTGGYHERHGSTSTVQVYDPGSDTWTLAAPMSRARSRHTATLLPDGRVLVVGHDNYLDPGDFAEIYDPAANRWSRGHELDPRMMHSATLLPDGDVLLAGGHPSCHECPPPENVRYNLEKGPAPTADSIGPLSSAAATTLADGRVVVVSGIRTWVYDGESDTWSRLGDPLRWGVSAIVALRGGRVLGFTDGTADGAPSPAQVLDPATGEWSLAGTPHSPHGTPSAFAMLDNHVVVLGGVPATTSVERFAYQAPPNVPGDMHLSTQEGPGRVRVIWSRPDGGPGVDGYALARRIGNGALTPVASTDADAWTYLDTELPLGEVVTYEVRAVNAYGSSVALVRSILVPKPPSPPTGLSAAVDPSSGSVTLSWSPPDHDGGDPPWGYVVRRVVDGQQETHLVTTAGNVTTYLDRDVPRATPVTYSVVAVNTAGDGERSTPVTVVVPAVPSPPTDVVASPGAGLQQITVRWAPPADDGGMRLSGFVVQRRTGDTEFSSIATVTANDTKFVDTELDLLQRYEYRVIARNGAGDSDPSATSAARPFPIGVVPV